MLDPPIGVAEALELGRRGLVAETDVIRTIEVTESTLRRLEKLGNRRAGQLHRRRAHFGREVELRKRGHRGRAARCLVSLQLTGPWRQMYLDELVRFTGVEADAAALLPRTN